MNDGAGRRSAALVMLLTPLFFSSNLIFGKWTVPEVAPFTLAFLRWGTVAVVLSPFIASSFHELRTQLPRIILLAVLGMWICGAIVYLALDVTTATNATLIYTTSPVFVLLIERMFGRALHLRQLVGCGIAMLGVAVIVLDGRIENALARDLNWGDLAVLGCAVSWAVYSIAFRAPELRGINAAALFGMIAAVGALTLAPFALWEWLMGAPMPSTSRAWSGLAGIVAFSSLAAFGGYQFGLRRFGAATTSVFMYLLPIYGVLLAVVFLGESVHAHHAVGVALALGGVVLATRPIRATLPEGKRW